MDVSFIYVRLMDCIYARQCGHHDPVKCAEANKPVGCRPDCFEVKSI